MEGVNTLGYLSISNLYKSQDILLFKECYALEKIHGTSSNIHMKRPEHCVDGAPKITFFSGGEPHEKFIKLFNEEELYNKFLESGAAEVIVYGEAYGGKCQGMSGTYGKELKFIAFDVLLNERWLPVPEADDYAKRLGLEFVDYVKIPTDLAALNFERDKPSVQAIRNGITEPREREGIVIRPLMEMSGRWGNRIIAKHKGEKFNERATPQKVIDPEKLKVLTEATAIATEWVVPHRLEHILQKLPQDIGAESMGVVIKAMIEDISREAKGEIIESKDVHKAIGKRTAELFKQHLARGIRV